MARLALYISANIELGRDFSNSRQLIIAVRYFPSTIAYHAVARHEAPSDCMRALDYLIQHCRLPDALIIVEASHQERVKRAAAIDSLLSESDHWTLHGDVHAGLTQAFREIANSISVPVLILDTTERASIDASEAALDWLRAIGLV